MKQENMELLILLTHFRKWRNTSAISRVLVDNKFKTGEGSMEDVLDRVIQKFGGF
jgi:hypothetical protein